MKRRMRTIPRRVTNGCCRKLKGTFASNVSETTGTRLRCASTAARLVRQGGVTIPRAATTVTTTEIVDIGRILVVGTDVVVVTETGGHTAVLSRVIAEGITQRTRRRCVIHGVIRDIAMTIRVENANLTIQHVVIHLQLAHTDQAEKDRKAFVNFTLTESAVKETIAHFPIVLNRLVVLLRLAHRKAKEEEKPDPTPVVRVGVVEVRVGRKVRAKGKARVRALDRESRTSPEVPDAHGDPDRGHSHIPLGRTRIQADPIPGRLHRAMDPTKAIAVHPTEEDGQCQRLPLLLPLRPCCKDVARQWSHPLIR